MSRKKVLIILSILFIFVLALFAYDLYINGFETNKNIGKMVAVAASFLLAIIRLLRGDTKRRKLSFYKSFYENKIGDAFIGDVKSLRKLLSALRLYNEDKLNAAAKKLEELQSKCITSDDRIATGLFLALCYEEMGLSEKAVAVYENLIERRLENETIFVNFGSLMHRLGNNERALYFFGKVIEMNSGNAHAYNNLANLYFDIYDLEQAEINAKKALWNDAKLYQSASLLAIIYSIRGDNANAEKYSHMAIASGQNPENLRMAIARYKKQYLGL